ncbi:Vacuolar amino acid transporter 1 [Nymphaea thermarum]|nr:Vacuolar amino acid transporter 1 [Nymphaea thermarum]
MDANPCIRTYQDIGGLAFGTKGRTIVVVLLFCELYLVAVEFLILEGDGLAKLFPTMSFRVGAHTFVANQVFIVLSAFVLLPTVWLKNLKWLAYVSAGGVAASFIILAAVVWAATVDGVGFVHQKGKLFDLSGMPSAVSVYAFCYCGHSMFPTICSSMKDRTKFTKARLYLQINYASMAAIGYLMFGSHVRSQVTLNLPLDKMSSKVAIYVTLINPLTKYALVVTPIALTMEESLLFCNQNITSFVARTILVATTVLVALAFPFFGYLMALIGSLFSMALSVLLPCIFYLKICKGSRRSIYELVIITAVVLVGCFIAIIGTYSSLRKIIDHIQ